MIDTTDPSCIIVGLDPKKLSTLDEVEKAYVLSVYMATGENCARTARLLGVSRRLLYRRLERYGMKRPPRGVSVRSAE